MKQWFAEVVQPDKLSPVNRWVVRSLHQRDALRERSQAHVGLRALLRRMRTVHASQRTQLRRFDLHYLEAHGRQAPQGAGWASASAICSISLSMWATRAR